jgi:hypothetical protein
MILQMILRQNKMERKSQSLITDCRKDDFDQLKPLLQKKRILQKFAAGGVLE